MDSDVIPCKKQPLKRKYREKNYMKKITKWGLFLKSNV